MQDPELVHEIIEKTLENNRLLGDLLSPENKENLVATSIIRAIETGEALCLQKQLSNSMFLIIDGEVEIHAEVNGNTTPLGKLGTGDLVGEISALFQMPRIATVTATKPSVVLEIPGNVFADMLAGNPVLLDTIVERSKNRVIETTLRSVPVFSNLGKQAMDELVYLSSLLKVQKNVVIANEGKTERCLYVICKGTARVFITANGKQLPIALLQPGDYFGEKSLLTGESRNASVAAVTDMHLVLLEGEAFQSFMDNNEDTEQQLNLDTLERQHSTELARQNLAARQSAESQLLSNYRL